VAFFTLFAHTRIEPPGQIYGAWARNLSPDAVLYRVDPEHQHNLLNGEYPVLGALATALSVALTALLVLAAIVAVRDAVGHRAEGRSAPRRPQRSKADDPRGRGTAPAPLAPASAPCHRGPVAGPRGRFPGRGRGPANRARGEPHGADGGGMRWRW
jgi:hypothetical protein